MTTSRFVAPHAKRLEVFLSQYAHDYYRRPFPSLNANFHTVTGGYLEQRKREQEGDKESQRPRKASHSVALYHSTPTPERFAVVVFSLASLSAAAMAGSYAIRAFRELNKTFDRMEKQLDEEEKEEQDKRKQQKKIEEEEELNEQQKQQQQQAGTSGESDSKRENVFAKWFGASVGANYYEGGFEETMTRREAARILGVRESSPVQRIKEAHRKLLVLNHPDTGGSTFIAGKINEAKELLLKGRRDK